jgi:hypothetical protein
MHHEAFVPLVFEIFDRFGYGLFTTFQQRQAAPTITFRSLITSGGGRWGCGG